MNKTTNIAELREAISTLIRKTAEQYENCTGDWESISEHASHGDRARELRKLHYEIEGLFEDSVVEPLLSPTEIEYLSTPRAADRCEKCLHMYVFHHYVGGDHACLVCSSEGTECRS